VFLVATALITGAVPKKIVVKEKGKRSLAVSVSTPQTKMAQHEGTAAGLTICVAVDGSENSFRALEKGINLVSSRGRHDRLVLLMVAPSRFRLDRIDFDGILWHHHDNIRSSLEARCWKRWWTPSTCCTSLTDSCASLPRRS
jgi:hypothetical protein